jgi:F420H(2)-dependent quinone reductase
MAVTASQFRSMSEKRRLDRLFYAFVKRPIGRRLFTGVFAKIDRAVMRRTRGRVQLAPGQPVCLLHTTGAKSGRPRTTPLLYTPRGGEVIVVASKGGSPTPPAWYHNLCAHPQVDVEIRGVRRPMRARELAGEERREAWSYVNHHYDGYEVYERDAGRVLPVIVLEPMETS